MKGCLMPIDFIVLQGISVYLSIKSMFLLQGKSKLGQLNATEFAFGFFMASLIAVAISSTAFLKIAVVYLFVVYLLVKGFQMMRTTIADHYLNKQLTSREEMCDRILPLIIDGNIQHENLNELKRTELWLRQQLKKFGYKDIKKISYCSLKGTQSFFIDLL